ncbi:MAG: metal ABC transporter substrate-binding protein [Anaerolineae bacterium]
MASAHASNRVRPSRCPHGRRGRRHAGLVVALLAAACTSPTPAAPPTPTAVPPTATPAPAVHAVATTSIVGDVVRAVGGDRVAVTVLIGKDGDPHDYKPTPGDLARIEQAAIVFENGLHLEAPLEPLLASTAARDRRVAVSDGVATMREAGAPFDNPHVWWDPVRVKVWAANIAAALGGADPPGASIYAANAERYAADLTALDGWIRERTAAVPADRRRLVTDHEMLGYFAAAYGFTEVGAVVASSSTGAEPSAKELAALEAAIRANGVTAIFSGESAPTAMTERVAADTGARVVTLYAEALSGPDGPAATYLAFMRHNVEVIVGALGSTAGSGGP